MAPKKRDTPASAPRSRLFAVIVAALIVALLGTTASFAFARGPLYGFLAKPGKPAKAVGSAARKGALAKATRVKAYRPPRGRNLPPLPLPLPEPTPTPTPPADTTAPETAISSGPAAT